MKFKVVNKGNYYSVEPTPDEEFLQEHYAKHYHNEIENLTPAEDEFLNNENELLEYLFNSIRPINTSMSMLDIGAGKGRTMEYFSKLVGQIYGIDYSTQGICNHNPGMAENLICGNMYEILEQLANEGKSYDLLNMDNVLEHVSDPVRAVKLTVKLMSSTSILRIEVPNDFSHFQNFLLKEKYIDNEYWVAPPEHINFFNSSGLPLFLESLGLHTVKLVGDFPVELYLLNEHSNYKKDNSKGKNVHKTRITYMNYIMKSYPLIDIADTLEASAKIGQAKNISAYVMKIK